MAAKVRLLFSLLLLGACSVAFAETCTNPTYDGSGPGGNYTASSPSGVCAQAASYMTGHSGGMWGYSAGSVTGGPASGHCNIVVSSCTNPPSDPHWCDGQGQGESAGGIDWSRTCHNADCNTMPAPDALTFAGSQVNGCYMGCTFAAGRTMRVTAGGVSWSATAEVTPTHQSCSTGAEANPFQKGECATVGGVTGCVYAQSSGKNCGTVNGDQVCIDSLQNNQCQIFSSGGVACATDLDGNVASPPGPDTGTGGVPAAPTAVLTGTSASTGQPQRVNYYSSTVVNQSAAGVSVHPTGTSTGTNSTATGSGVGGGSGSGSGSSGDGKGNAGTSCGNGKTADGADCKDSSVSGGGSCGSPPSCTGDAVMCDIDLQQWKARCPDSISDGDILGAVGSADPAHSDSVAVDGVSGSLFGSGGSCPSPLTLLIMGASIAFDMWSRFCDWLQMIRPLVLLFAYLAAARVFLGSL